MRIITLSEQREMAKRLPEVQELIAAAKQLRIAYGTDWEFNSKVADRMDNAFAPFEENNEL